MVSKVIIVFLFVQSFVLISRAMGNSQKWYYTSSTHETWVDARASCRSIGMQLVEIDSNQKNQQLGEYFKRRTYGTSTVNGFQILNYWTAGNTLDRKKLANDSSPNNIVGFTSWAPGQPDNNKYYGDEHCIELLYFTNNDLLWNDANCMLKKQYVCETV